MSDDVRAILAKLQRSAQATLCSLSIPPIQPRPVSEVADIPPLCLPPPEDIRPLLRRLDLPNQIILALTDSFRNAITKLRRQCEHQYNNAVKSLMTIPHPAGPEYTMRIVLKTAETYRHMYHNNFVRKLRNEVIRQATVWCDTNDQIQQPRKRKTPFNSQFTPVLERFFEYKAYPSASERLMLARCSMMAPRQIEVWFQNHRNRAKKDGKVLPRRAVKPIPPSLLSFISVPSATKNPEQMGYTDSPENSSDEEFDHEDFLSTSQLHPFSQVSPAHAFPTPYPLKCSVDPFSPKNGTFTFPAPDWKRQPVSVQRAKDSVDLDELTITFARLSLRERKEGNKTGTQYSRSRWSCPFVTKSYPAPLPSFVPYCRTLATQSSQLFTASLKSTTRKEAPFPKRLPSCMGAQGFSAFADCRVSSFSSTTSCQSRSTSTSSTNTTPLPNTPPPLPVCSLVFTDDDFHGLDDLFGVNFSDVLGDFCDSNSFVKDAGVKKFPLPLYDSSFPFGSTLGCVQSC